MNFQVYHPNKNSTGFAASFSFSEKDNNFYATIIKQSGWNDETQNGTFKGNMEDPNGRVNVKLSAFEVAGILDCIEKGRDFKKFHDGDETPKQIMFTKWMDKSSPPIHKGYSFSVSVSNKQDVSYKNSFYIGLTFEEARLLREYLVYSLHQYFSKATFKNQ